MRPGTVILHGRGDDVIPFAESEELAKNSGATLIEAGTDHRLADTEPLASPLQHARQNPDDCPPFVIAAVKQRPEAVSESKALNAVLPKSTLVVVDYPGSGQLAAHGLIAKELADFDKDLTKQLVKFVRDTPAAGKKTDCRIGHNYFTDGIMTIRNPTVL